MMTNLKLFITENFVYYYQLFFWYLLFWPLSISNKYFWSSLTLQFLWQNFSFLKHFSISRRWWGSSLWRILLTMSRLTKTLAWFELYFILTRMRGWPWWRCPRRCNPVASWPPWDLFHSSIPARQKQGLENS